MVTSDKVSADDYRATRSRTTVVLRVRCVRTTARIMKVSDICAVIFLLLVTSAVTSAVYNAPRRGYSMPPGRGYPMSSPTLQYLPAGPGQTPACARNGATYCTEVDNYPTDKIWYLLKAKKFDFDSLLVDESRNSYVRTPAGKFVLDTYYNERQAPQVDMYNNERRVPQVDMYNNERPSPQVHMYNNERPAPEVDMYNNERRAPQVDMYNNKRHSPAPTSNVYNDWVPVFSPTRYFGHGHSRGKRQATSTTQLCPTRASYIQPMTAQNIEGDWMFVVAGVGATQFVNTETCIADTCTDDCSLPLGFTSRCSQRFAQKRLVALNGTGETLYNDRFWFPTCCVCEVVPIG